jgi:hypothetical protein
VDPFVKLARVPRRPPWTDVLVAGALLAWALTEALAASGPARGPVRRVPGVRTAPRAHQAGTAPQEAGV